jgi:hypothetical protein
MWLIQDHFIPSNFDFDQFYLLMFFDEKNSIMSLKREGAEIKEFFKPTKANKSKNKGEEASGGGGGGKKGKKKILKRDLLVWHPTMIQGLVENREQYLMNKKTAERMVSKSKKWLQISLYGQEVFKNSLGEKLIDSDDDGDGANEEDDEEEMRRHHERMQQYSEQRTEESELSPEVCVQPFFLCVCVCVCVLYENKSLSFFSCKRCHHHQCAPHYSSNLFMYIISLLSFFFSIIVINTSIFFSFSFFVHKYINGGVLEPSSRGHHRVS